MSVTGQSKRFFNAIITPAAKSITSVFILLLFPIILGLNVQAQPQPNRNNARLVGNMLQRLERSSSRFRNSLNVALVQRSVDQTQPQNDISTFQSGLDLAIKQFRDQFTRRLAVASDVEVILQNASPIDSFITRNTLNARVKSDWASMRTDLNTLASASGVSWQWNQVPPMKVDSNRSFRLSESELTQLIQQIGIAAMLFVRVLQTLFSNDLTIGPEAKAT